MSSLCVGCSLLEQKVEQLTEIATELTGRQLEREATALEYKRCMHACLLDVHDVLLNHPVCLDAATKCSLHKGTTLMQILPLCYLHLVAASRSYTCAQGGLDTVQLALVVFFLPPTSENTPLAVMVVITCCNLRWWCFSLEH